MKIENLFKNAMLVLLICSTFIAGGQGTAINTSGAAANSSALLDVSSTTQGVLVPRMSSTQRTSITSPATGLLVYQTDGTPGFYFYSGSAWTSLSGGAPTGAAGGDLTGTYPNPTIASTTGSGSIVRATSPTLVTPALGTPSSVNLSNATNLPAGAMPALTGDVTSSAGSVSTSIANNNTSGNHIASALTSANFGSTAGTVTGTGAVVLSSSPTLASPSLGTPTALVGTNISGTAPNLTAGDVGTSATAGGHMVTAINAVTGTGSVINTARLGTGSGSATTFLNGTGAFSTPSSGSTGVTFFTCFNDGNTSTTGNWYAPLSGAMATTDQPTTATASFSNRTVTVAPIGCTFNQLNVASNVATAGSGTGTEIFTLYVNGAATSVTCSMTSNYGTLGTKGSCSDVSHTVTVVPGDMLSIQWSENNLSAYIEVSALLKCQ